MYLQKSPWLFIKSHEKVSLEYETIQEEALLAFLT